jgi:hypothetical protein
LSPSSDTGERVAGRNGTCAREVGRVDGFAAGRISAMTRIFDLPLTCSTQTIGSLIVITGSMFSSPVSAPTVLVGTEESYDARCRHCHEDVFEYGFPGAQRTVVTG